MSDQVLLVDDEQNVLSALRRGLRGRFSLDVAEGGPAALDMLREKGPYAVVVSDMRMPEVDGLGVLSTARREFPDTVRIMLTGNADQKTATDAVNQGAIFRFLNKPCPSDVLAETLEEAIRQHQILLAERSLLTRTLTGTIALVTEVLSVVNPTAYGRAGRLRQLAKQMCPKVRLPESWQVELAAMLSQVGCVAVPEALLAKQAEGKPLTPSEEQTLSAQAGLGSKLVGNIPRLEQVSEIIALHGQRSSTGRAAAASSAWIEESSQLITLLIDFDQLASHLPLTQVFHRLQQDATERYRPEHILALAEQVLGEKPLHEANVRDLVEGMVLEEHVMTTAGDILISKGHELTQSLIQRIRSFENNSAGVRQPIRVSSRVTPPRDGRGAAELN
ncbi:MAG: response regulator [Pirellulales bacterium]